MSEKLERLKSYWIGREVPYSHAYYTVEDVLWHESEYALRITAPEHGIQVLIGLKSDGIHANYGGTARQVDAYAESSDIPVNDGVPHSHYNIWIGDGSAFQTEHYCKRMALKDYVCFAIAPANNRELPITVHIDPRYYPPACIEDILDMAQEVPTTGDVTASSEDSDT